jgi:hypothetical protein
MCGAVLLFFGCKEETAIVEPQNGNEVNPPPGTDSLTLASLTKIDDHPAYTMNYYSNYTVFGDSGGSLISGITARNRDKTWGCTCFAAFGDSAPHYFCRNFDWNYCIPLILFTDPPGGYASVSVVDLEYLGYNNGNLPDEWNKREKLLGAFQLPFDGINETGLSVGMMAINSAIPPYDPSRKSVGELQIIRLILDSAKNIDEAITIMGNYNIIMDGPPIHYMVADSFRNSVIVEFVEGEMVLHRNGEPWQVCTNFIITGSGAPDGVACWRYNEVYTMLDETNGNLKGVSAMELLQVVSQTSTIWSSVYDISAKSLNLAIGRNYSDVKLFSVSQVRDSTLSFWKN